MGDVATWGHVSASTTVPPVALVTEGVAYGGAAAGQIPGLLEAGAAAAPLAGTGGLSTGAEKVPDPLAPLVDVAQAAVADVDAEAEAASAARQQLLEAYQ